jgi:hypothetical protein
MERGRPVAMLVLERLRWRLRSQCPPGYTNRGSCADHIEWWNTRREAYEEIPTETFKGDSVALSHFQPNTGILHGMAYITLAVTAKVIQQAADRPPNQRQIAIRNASRDVQSQIDAARKDNFVAIPISGEFELIVGDTGAIWYSHQGTNLQTSDFMNIYELLARRPDRPVTFLW